MLVGAAPVIFFVILKVLCVFVVAPGNLHEFGIQNLRHTKSYEQLWDSQIRMFEKGKIVKGTILPHGPYDNFINEYGVLIHLDDGVDALIPFSELEHFRYDEFRLQGRVNSLRELEKFAKRKHLRVTDGEKFAQLFEHGDNVVCVIRRIDHEKMFFKLSWPSWIDNKAEQPPNKWPEHSYKYVWFKNERNYRTGDYVQGRISAENYIRDDGVHVRLNDEIEGIIPFAVHIVLDETFPFKDRLELFQKLHQRRKTVSAEHAISVLLKRGDRVECEILSINYKDMYFSLTWPKKFVRSGGREQKKKEKVTHEHNAHTRAQSQSKKDKPFEGTISKINGDGAIVELSKADHPDIVEARIPLNEAENIKLRTFPFRERVTKELKSSWKERTNLAKFQALLFPGDKVDCEFDYQDLTEHIVYLKWPIEINGTYIPRH